MNKINDSAELKNFVERMKKPIRYERKPSRYDERTGEAVEFKEVPVYADHSDKRIGLKGSFMDYQMVSPKLEKKLLEIWKPIIIDSEFLIYPVGYTSEGYNIKYYQLAKYAKCE